MPYAVFLFATTHDTVKAERLASAAGITAEVIPQPPGDKGRCGVALRVPRSQKESLAHLLIAGGLPDFEVEER